MSVKTEWNLQKYFFDSPDDPRIQTLIDQYVSDIAILKQRFDNDDTSLEKLYDLLESKLGETIIPVWRYYNFCLSLDQQNNVIHKKKAELLNIYTKLSNETLFINEFYKRIGSEELIRISNLEKFIGYKNYIYQIAINLKHLLPQEHERLLNDHGKITDPFDDLRSKYTTTFSYYFLEQELNEEEISKYLMDKSVDIRKQASELIYENYSRPDRQIIFGALYTSVCKTNVFEIKERKYETVISRRAIGEEINPEIIKTLISKVKEYYPVYQKFLKIKAKLLGQEKLHSWDLRAPLSYDIEDQWNFEKGLNFYLSCIKNFDAFFYEFSKSMVEEERISVYPKKGKQSGAYSSSYKNAPSFILLNWKNKFDDVTTLAHELGHSIHGELSQKQNKANYNSSLCLCETASIFNETMVFDEFISSISGDEKTYYLVKKLEDLFGTIFRQVSIVSFEMKCHQAFLDEKELSYEDYNQIWDLEQSELFGDSIYPNDRKKVSWSQIPHIFATPFYCYSYAFGNILSLSLYQQYKSKPLNEFLPMYKSILEAGGSKPPQELLKEHGIDCTSPEFYQNSFDYINELIKQLE